MKLSYGMCANLLSNAIKYSPNGGQVCFDIREEANRLILEISDEGIGIPLADQAHLFEMFHRAGNTGKIQGTGLGLTIVKQNVEVHGGTLTFKSQKGVGTTFTVRIPLVSAS
jgi:signal transduction histidine kinase